MRFDLSSVVAILRRGCVEVAVENIEAVKTIIYRCRVCGAEYKTRGAADRACGSYKVEPAEYKVGDKVTVWHANKYRKAEVTKVVGPIIGNSFKGGKRRRAVDAHVYMYRVKPLATNSEVQILCEFWTSELKRK